MCTITDIAPAIVKCVQIYMVYFIARPVFKQIIMAVSYTHLDVYKRQPFYHLKTAEAVKGKVAGG